MCPHQKHFSPKCTKYRLAAGFARTRWGSLQRSPDPDGFKGRSSKGRERAVRK